VPTIAYAAPFALQDVNTFGAASGTPTFATTGVRAGGGTHRMQCAAAGAVCRADYSHPAATRVIVESFYYRQTANPSANAGIFTALNASGNAALTSLAAGGMRVAVGAGANGTTSAALTANQWYRIDLRVVVSGGTTTIDWYLDGVLQGSANAVQADADITASRFGQNAAVTHTAEFMDHAGSYTTSDYPLGEYIADSYDLSAVVGANHNLGAGAYQKTTTTAITSADTNSQAELTEHPYAIAQFVAQTAIAATTYLDYPVTDTTRVQDPVLVRVGIQFAGSTTGGYQMEVRAFDGTTEGTDLTAPVAANKTAATTRYYAATLTSPPSGGSWTRTKFNALRLRFGFSGDVTPNPRLGGLSAMAVFPPFNPHRQMTIVGQAINRSYMY
jgi:hypothetical protein